MAEKRVRLERSLKPANIWAIALGSIIGFGCFILPGELLQQAGPLGATFGIAIGGSIMLFIARSYGFMVKKIPVAGGEFAYAYKGFGRNHAFICGWMLTLGYLCIIPLNATALPIIAKDMFPKYLTAGHIYTIADFKVYLPQVLLSSGAIMLFGYLNYCGARIVGRLQLLMVLLLVSAVALLGAGSFAEPTAKFQNLSPLFASSQPWFYSVLSIVAIAPWAFVGYGTIPQASEEFNFSPSKAFALIIMAILFGAVMYIIVLLATAAAGPWESFIGANINDWPTSEAMQLYMGKFGKTILLVGVTMAICTGINGFYLASSRLVFGMARAKILPAWFGKVHPVHKTPSNAILFAMLLSLVAPWFGRVVIHWIVKMAATGTAIGYVYTCLAAWCLSKGFKDHKARFTHLIAVLFACGFLVLLLVPKMPGHMERPSWIALGLWVGMGVIFYVMQAKEYRAIDTRTLDHLILDAQDLDDDENDMKKAI